MMRRLLTVLAVALPVAAAAWAASPTSAPAPGGTRAASFSDYQLILDRNMFSRDRSSGRGRYTPSFSRPSSPSPGPRYDYALVLTGVIQQDGLQIAFIEDTRSGETYRVAAGTAIAGGVVKSVSMEGIEFSQDDSVRKCAVGDSITGVAGAASRTADSGVATGATSAPSDSATNSVLERMRLRRLQETK
jgi:hypothetical protein